MTPTPIQSGMDLLDEKRPGWRAELRLSDLDMRQCEFCVLGQLYGHYASGLSSIGIPDGEIDCAVAYGFSLPTELDLSKRNERWDSLTSEWLEAIEEAQTPSSK